MSTDDMVRELGRIRKNSRSQFVVSEVVRNGTERVEVRVFEEDGARQMRPTKHAMQFSRQALDALLRVLRPAT